MIKIKVGKFEGDLSVDTKREALTAFYIAKKYTREISKRKIGALRLGAMWLFHTAENPKNKSNYYKALQLISKHSGVSIWQMKQYYAKAVKAKIWGTPIGNALTSAEKQKARQLLYIYMVNPNTANASAFRWFRRRIRFQSNAKIVALNNFVSKISSTILMNIS